MPKFEYLTTKVGLDWDGRDFYINVDVSKGEMTINELGAMGWEFIGFFPDAHAIGDQSAGHKNKKDGWILPNQRVGIFKRQVG